VPDLESCFTCENLSTSVESLLDGHFDVIAERPRIQTGADRIELILFLRDRDQHLATINRKVLSNRYTFRPFLERQIPKPDSTEKRTISIASIRDVVVQRAMYEYLYPVVESRLTPSVFGYRKGTSAHDAVRLVRNQFENGKICVFDADLEKFFDTVDHDVLLGMVAELDLDDRAVTLIRRFLKTGRVPSSQVEEHKKRQGNEVKYRPEPRTIGVPQGGVLSGLLSNLYLSGFDAAIRQHHEGYVRYADDFLVCCRSTEECAQVHALVKSQLEALRVRLHPKKTKEFVPATPGVDFLGCRISARGIRIRGRNIQNF
jgi:RNA-directed DNA polymerase